MAVPYLVAVLCRVFWICSWHVLWFRTLASIWARAPRGSLSLWDNREGRRKVYVVKQTQKLRTVSSSSLIYWSICSSLFWYFCFAARMHRDGKAKYFLEVKEAWSRVKKAWLLPLLSLVWLRAEPCQKWKDILAVTITHSALGAVGKQLPLTVPSTAQPACRLQCWETASNNANSHLSADPAVGICRTNAFDKAFNVLKLLCLTVNIKCIYIPFIKFYIEMFQFVARKPGVAWRIILLQLGI